MPQERLRSVVYRSFLTCDDPKGVAECKNTITRSKNKTPNDEQKLQIMEVSRKADKLNEIIDSRSNFIAQDLLQGALHLQESLLVLTKLQQASKQSKKMLCPLPLPSRDVYDELREVIRESFARQKILTGKEGSCLDLPSTSSSSGGSSSQPNLIAKLMGLDEVPLRRDNLGSFIQKEKKFSSLVDIDLLRTKKEGRKLEEMIDDTPIVIMKPLHCQNYPSINEEKQIKIIKKTTILMPQNVQQVYRGQKKMLHKYTQKKLQAKLGAGKAPVKMNHHKPPAPRMQKKESVIRKKIDDDKPKIATKDVGKKVSTLKRESHVSKGQIAEQKESIKFSFPNKNLGKNTKPKRKLSASLVENIPSDVNIECNNQGSLVKDIAEEVIIPCSNVSISDNASPCVSSSKGDVDEDENCTPHFLDKSKDCKSTRSLLLSSTSFLNHVEEELFDTGTCVFLSDGIDKETIDDSLLLDCAKELLSRKSLRCSNARMVNPSLRTLLDDKSIQELVEEISDGIECLRMYSKSYGDVLEDRVYAMLERDLWGNEEVIGAWDLGWRRDGYTMEAMKEVVHEIEKLILSEFVVDVVVEFMGQL